MEDNIQNFINRLFQYITGKHTALGAIVKKHCDNLSTHGDLSFPTSLNPWTKLLENICHIEKREGIDLLEYIGRKEEYFIEESKHWCLQISKIVRKSERLYIFLHRGIAIDSAIKLNGQEKCKWILNKINQNVKYSYVKSDPFCEQSNDLTSLRVKCLKSAIENLYFLSGNSTNVDTIFVSNKSFKMCSEENNVFCGAVLNSKTGLKETSITSEEYIKIRQDEMTLIAQHKYGVRVKSDSKWSEFLEHLGNSAVIYELLQVKPSNSVKINFECSAGSSKGAAFVLYNCARLETILRTFQEKVIEGVYPSLPPLKEIDFNLLSDEDEWILVFNFILGFPSMMTSCVNKVGNKYDFRPHNICTFLSSMVKVVSQYYRKIRILTEPRKHLFPVMYARIYLLMTLNTILKTCLEIINIKSVSQM